MCDPILVTLTKMQPHNGQSSHENATPSSDTSPLAYYFFPFLERTEVENRGEATEKTSTELNQTGKLAIMTSYSSSICF